MSQNKIMSSLSGRAGENFNDIFRGGKTDDELERERNSNKTDALAYPNDDCCESNSDA